MRRLSIFPIAIALVVIAFQFCSSPKFKNPETGKSHKVALSPQQESMLGLESYKEVLAGSQVVENGPEYEMVNRVARKLIPATGDAGKDFEWHVSLVKNPQINAFCLPGGKIVVFTGILAVTRTEAGLAAVMGHEIAHATSRHGAQRLFKHSVTQTALMGASMSLGNLDSRERQTVMALLGAGAQFGVMLPFGRSDEVEADQIGLLYMARAGLTPAKPSISGSGCLKPVEINRPNSCPPTLRTAPGCKTFRKPCPRPWWNLKNPVPAGVIKSG